MIETSIPMVSAMLVMAAFAAILIVTLTNKQQENFARQRVAVRTRRGGYFNG